MAAPKRKHVAEAGTFSEDSDKLNRVGIAAALSYAVVFVLVGVPIWWKTTEVYRVSLPYETISSLNDQQLDIPIDIAIAVCERNTVETPDEYSNVEEQLKNVTIGELVQNKFRVSLRWHVRQCTSEELAMSQSSSSLQELDEALHIQNAPEIGNVRVLILPSTNRLMGKFNVLMGNHRTMFLKMKQDLLSTCSGILSALDNIINPQKLKLTYEIFANFKTETSHKSSMNSLPSTPEVDVTFTLILPDASLTDVTWDIDAAIQSYFTPLDNKLRNVIKFHCTSQVFYLTKLKMDSKFNGDLQHHVLAVDQLSPVINSVESKLGSYTSTNPSLNFVVYVPPKHLTPLHIYEQGKPSDLNAFLIPRWGGFLFYNILRDGSNNMRGAKVDMQHVMGIFLEQFRSLLGVSGVQTSSASFSLFAPDSTHLRDWEYDAIIRMRLIENLLTSAATLQSLAQLLEEIYNIVINDHVGDQIYRAAEKIAAGYRALSSSQILSAFFSSKEALASSETAFFDPSMLSQLYFPEDQKYAIYVPLFLPVSFPLVATFFSLGMWYWRKRRGAVPQKDNR